MVWRIREIDTRQRTRSAAKRQHQSNQQCKNDSVHGLMVAKRWLFFQEIGSGFTGTSPAPGQHHPEAQVSGFLRTAE